MFSEQRHNFETVSLLSFPVVCVIWLSSSRLCQACRQRAFFFFQFYYCSPAINYRAAMWQCFQLNVFCLPALATSDATSLLFRGGFYILGSTCICNMISFAKLCARASFCWAYFPVFVQLRTFAWVPTQLANCVKFYLSAFDRLSSLCSFPCSRSRHISRVMAKEAFCDKSFSWSFSSCIFTIILFLSMLSPNSPNSQLFASARSSVKKSLNYSFSLWSRFPNQNSRYARFSFG